MLKQMSPLLSWVGVDPRGCRALVGTLVLSDLRGQHYAAATATRPGALFSPLFLVVGQCQTLSALLSLFLFVRVDVWFFAFANLTVGLLILATTLLVEFQEVVLNPQDLEILGYQPVTPRTYAASRLANLGLYFLLMVLALHLIPAILGTGLRDAGPWFLPAYALAALVGSLVVTALVIVALSFGSISGQLEAVKTLLAWTQIIAIMLVFYGGQLMLRDAGSQLLVWAAFPPAWVAYLPTTWLARYVESAVRPDGSLLKPTFLLLGLALISVVGMVSRVTWLYRTMHATIAPATQKPMPARFQGGLRGAAGAWLARTTEERIGFWMCLTMLRRDPDLLMRSILTFAMALGALLIGLVTGQFANPCQVRDVTQIALPILSFYLLGLAVPTLIYNLTFVRDNEGSWLWFTAPLIDPAGLTRGACKAVLLWIVVPCCALIGLVAGIVWQDLLSALLHALLALVLSWLTALTAQWLLVPALPFSRSPTRGGSLGLPPLSMLALSSVVMFLAGLHSQFADRWEFWAALVPAAVIAEVLLRRSAQKRLAQLARPE